MTDLALELFIEIEIFTYDYLLSKDVKDSVTLCVRWQV